MREIDDGVAPDHTSVVGVADARLAPVIADVLRLRGTKALVVRGDEGLDELSTHTTSTVWNVLGADVKRETFDPASIGIAAPPADALTGGDAKFNAEIVSDLFAGLSTPKLDAVSDAVCLNAAAALTSVDAVTSEVLSLQTSLAHNFEKARAAIASGDAQRTLQRWVEETQSISRNESQ